MFSPFEYRQVRYSDLHYSIKPLIKSYQKDHKLISCKAILIYLSSASLNHWGPNFGEAGSQLEICRRGEYLSFVTLVESKPNLKFDELNQSYSTPTQISSPIPSYYPSFKYKSQVFTQVRQ